MKQNIKKQEEQNIDRHIKHGAKRKKKRKRKKEKGKREKEISK